MYRIPIASSQWWCGLIALPESTHWVTAINKHCLVISKGWLDLSVFKLGSMDKRVQWVINIPRLLSRPVNLIMYMCGIGYYVEVYFIR
jgi:hypothetical protein